MVKTALVEPDIDDGRRLVEHLDGQGFPVWSAFWFYLSDEAEWRLVVASQLVDRKGPRQAYERLQSALETMSPPPSFNLRNISVVTTRDPRARLLAQAIQTGPGTVGIRFSKNTVNGVFIEDAYIYRLRAA